MMKRILLVLSSLLLFALPVFGQGGILNDSVLRADGTPAIGATVRVCTEAASGTPCSPTASIWSDKALTISKTNPIAVDSAAAYTYYAAPAFYKEQICLGGTCVNRTVQFASDATSIILDVTTILVTFSATPTFDSSASVYFALTLTGNVTSSTISNSATGRIIYFRICQDATGGRTFVWPASVPDPPTIDSTASACTSPGFIFDGTSWRNLTSAAGTGIYDVLETSNLDGILAVEGNSFTADCAGFNAAAAAIPSTGGIILLKPGTTYAGTVANPCTIPTGSSPIAVLAYGATVTTTGAISGMKITGGSTIGPRSIFGLRVDHRDNATALYGFNIEGAWNARCYDCTVVADDVSATYGAFRIGNTDPLDGSTGSFWTKLINPWVRRFTAGDGTAVPFALIIEGNANATSVIGGGLNGGTTDAVVIRNQGAGTAIPNGILIDGVAFEGYTTAIHVDGPAASNIAGMRFVNNRFENGTTVFSFTTVTAQPSANPFLAGNFLTSNAGTYLNNPNNLRTNQWDFSETPAISPIITRTLTVEPSNSPVDNAIVASVSSASSKGILLKTSAGARLLNIVGITSDNVRMVTGSGKNLEINGSGSAGYISITPGGTNEMARFAVNINTFAPLAVTLSNSPRWIFKQVDHTDMTAAATADTFTLWTLPANTMIHDVVGTIVTAWAGTGPVTAAVCSVGTQAGSANDLTLDDDFFAAATVYELHDATANGGKGTLLFDATDKFAPSMFVAGGVVEVQCDLTGGNHSTTSAGQARIYILVSQPLGNTTLEAN